MICKIGADNIGARLCDVANREHQRVAKALTSFRGSSCRQIQNSQFGKAEKESILRFDQKRPVPGRIKEVKQSSSGGGRYPDEKQDPNMEALNQLAIENRRQNGECSAENAEIPDRLFGKMQLIGLFIEKGR